MEFEFRSRVNIETLRADVAAKLGEKFPVTRGGPAQELASAALIQLRENGAAGVYEALVDLAVKYATSHYEKTGSEGPLLDGAGLG